MAIKNKILNLVYVLLLHNYNSTLEILTLNRIYKLQENNCKMIIDQRKPPYLIAIRVVKAKALWLQTFDLLYFLLDRTLSLMNVCWFRST